VKIKYLAHSSFLITSNGNVRIITDPYNVGQGLSYGPINETADIVTVSHGHSDHNNAAAIEGSPVILKEAGSRTIKGIEIRSIPVYHDEAHGTKRGNNLIFCFKIDELNICHLGDLGHPLNRQELSDLGQVNVLMIPIGGFFTIDAKEADSVARSIGAMAIIPMHYKTAKTDYPIKPVGEFMKQKKNVREVNSSEVKFTKDTLPREAEIIVLQPALVS
jgi:L-ascorbate metabolism protein UlaG (beta-lactamase superfamily)